MKLLQAMMIHLDQFDPKPWWPSNNFWGLKFQQKKDVFLSNSFSLAQKKLANKKHIQAQKPPKQEKKSEKLLMAEILHNQLIW